MRTTSGNPHSSLMTQKISGCNKQKLCWRLVSVVVCLAQIWNSTGTGQITQHKVRGQSVIMIRCGQLHILHWPLISTSTDMTKKGISELLQIPLLLPQYSEAMTYSSWGTGEECCKSDRYYYKYWREHRFLEKDHLSPEEESGEVLPVPPGMNTDRLPQSYLHIPECLWPRDISKSPRFHYQHLDSGWLQPIWPLRVSIWPLCENILGGGGIKHRYTV